MSGKSCRLQHASITNRRVLHDHFITVRIERGVEPHIYAFCHQPELLHRINADLAEWQVEMIEQIGSICALDFMIVAEDMSYNNEPMLARQQFDEFLAPYNARVLPAQRKLGVIPLVDSDGEVSVAAKWFVGAGIEGILPLERQAGVDIANVSSGTPASFLDCR